MRGEGSGTVVQGGVDESVHRVDAAARPLHELDVVAGKLAGSRRDAAVGADDLDALRSRRGVEWSGVSKEMRYKWFGARQRG